MKKILNFDENKNLISQEEIETVLNENINVIDSDLAIEILKNKKYFKKNHLNLSSFNKCFSIKEQSFKNKGIKSITFPQNLEIIQFESFADNDLKNIDLSKLNKLQVIEPFAFKNTKTKRFSLPKNIKSVDIKAFGEENTEILKEKLEQIWEK